MAAEYVQPVPWVCFVSIHSPGNTSTPSGVTSMSVARSVSRCPPLDQHGAGPVLQELPTGVFSVLAGPHVSLCQRLCLVHVGSDDGGQGKQFFPESAPGLVFEQPVARLGDHDRVQDEEWRPVLTQGGGDRLDYGAGGQHAGLDGGHGKVAEHSFELGLDQRGRELLGHDDRLGVLGRHRRDHRSAETAVGGDRAQVGLYARPAAGVRPRYGDDHFHCRAPSSGQHSPR